MNLTLCKPTRGGFLSNYLESEVDRFFDDFWKVGEQHFSPAVDIKEEEKEYTIKAELPGLSKEDLRVEIRDGVLTIKGEKKGEKSERKNGYHYAERRYGSFSRSFTLPENATPKIEANFLNGILTLTIPKSEEKREVKEIEIK